MFVIVRCEQPVLNFEVQIEEGIFETKEQALKRVEKLNRQSVVETQYNPSGQLRRIWYDKKGVEHEEFYGDNDIELMLSDILQYDSDKIKNYLPEGFHAVRKLRVRKTK